MEAQESNIICDIRKSSRRYYEAVSEYNKIKERENLINNEIVYNLKKLENEIHYLKFHLRYLLYQLHKFTSKEMYEDFKKFNSEERAKWRHFNKTKPNTHQTLV